MSRQRSPRVSLIRSLRELCPSWRAGVVFSQMCDRDQNNEMMMTLKLDNRNSISGFSH